MEIKSGIFDNKEQMEKEIKELLEKGYKIITSNIAFEPMPTIKGIGKCKLWYYILLQKE